MINKKSELFPLGKIIITTGIMKLIRNKKYLLYPFIDKHSKGNWGYICNKDKEANNQALINGERLISSYIFDNIRIDIITEHDRSSTTILLNEEY